MDDHREPPIIFVNYIISGFGALTFSTLLRGQAALGAEGALQGETQGWQQKGQSRAEDDRGRGVSNDFPNKIWKNGVPRGGKDHHHRKYRA
jgi:hypothetical protein